MKVSDSAIYRSDDRVALYMIEKSCSLIVCLYLFVCSLILEKLGLEIGRPVLDDTPLCSDIRILRFRPVEPIYLNVQSGH